MNTHNPNALPYTNKPATPTSQPPTPPIVIDTSKGTYNLGTEALGKLLFDIFQNHPKEGH